MYNAENIILTLLYVREKTPDIREKKFVPKLNHPYPTHPRKSHGQPDGGGGRGGLTPLIAGFQCHAIQ